MVWRGGDNTAVGEDTCPAAQAGVVPFPSCLGDRKPEAVLPEMSGEASRASCVKCSLVCLTQQPWSLTPRPSQASWAMLLRSISSHLGRPILLREMLH